MRLSDTGCQVCLRGRSAQEITRGYARARAEKAWRRRRPFVILASLAALGVGGYAYQRYQAAILNFGRQSMASFGRFYDANSDPAAIAPHYGAAADTASQSQPKPSASPADDSFAPQNSPAATFPPAPAPTPAPAPVAARVAPAGPPPVIGPRLDAPEPTLPNVAPGQWVLHGRVFDLKTLKILADARIAVKRGDYSFAFATSGPDGWYAITLPRNENDNDGYQLAAQQTGYAAPAQYEGDIPYAKLSASERTQLIQAAQEGDTHPSPLTGSADYVRRDVFLSPRR